MGLRQWFSTVLGGYEEPETVLKSEVETLESLHEVIEGLSERVMPGIDSKFANEASKVLKMLKDLETKLAQRMGFINWGHFKSMEQEDGMRRQVKIV